ncbi:gamma-butyrobetaine hydroxylase-like domain-containing protein [Echinimonas agarilytica]|uniref:DUF971 domain-containing protein n=1 Tax=Echinimonas agarilytica TaxID=1215918 RepID=A0AA42B623_9GAMM|nr:gamma-butyrobetaine hydroxylase-like domain-containing protein [Echinimonas agarilytica]MCM2678308.1 DUF971 domain-containing protein [Echinimonas agarilytica]
MKPQVTHIKLHRESQRLTLTFSDQLSADLSAEFLRVHSPSAEVQRHGKPIVVTDKHDVRMLDVQAVGHYAVRIIFDDGHDTGIYSWSWLHHLCQDQEQLKLQYQQQVALKNAEKALQIPISVRFNDD